MKRLFYEFRHLTEYHNLGGELFRRVDVYLEKSGCKLNRGTNVDATIIGVPRATKNKTHQRDSDIKSNHKGD